MSSYNFAVVIEEDEDGFFADCPALQGCHTQGETLVEAIANIKDAIQLHIEDRLAMGEGVPQLASLTVTTLQVSA